MLRPTLEAFDREGYPKEADLGKVASRKAVVLNLRYRLAKFVKWTQRLMFGAIVGFFLIISSHWATDPGEREWLRDAGGTIVGFYVIRWWSQQGKRRIHPETGREIRTPTLRLSKEEVDKVRANLWDRDGKT
jgi:hypothetical protein